MPVFSLPAYDAHEQVVFGYDAESGLRAIIAIHDTTLGPALGGCRMRNYADEDAAATDALRLARGMTLKAAAAGLNHGGGKAVIWGDPDRDKTPALLCAFGRLVESLGGCFITGPDMGTCPEDFVAAALETRHLMALPVAQGGSGDTGEITAYGVWRGMKAAALAVFGSAELTGRTVAVQGLGKVGRALVARLVAEGAEVIVSDAAPAAVAAVRQRFGQVSVAGPAEIITMPVDILAPCAVGGMINDETLPLLGCKIVAGAANNQLAADRHAEGLSERGILYCPDFVINAGGLIQVADEVRGFDRRRAYSQAAGIYDRLLEIFAISRAEGISTRRAAERFAERRLGRCAPQGEMVAG